MRRHLNITIGLLIAVVPSSVAAEEIGPGVTADKEKRTVTVDAKIAPRKLPNLEKEYPIEVIACWGHDRKDGKGQKAHETVVTIEALPSHVHKALEAIGLKPGAPVKGGEVPCTGPDVKVYLEWKVEGGADKKVSIDKTLIDPKTRKPFPRDVKFRFTGSVMSQPDPTKTEKKYGADLTGTLITVYPVSDETVCQSSLTMKEEKFLKLDTNRDLLPKEDTPVKLILEIPQS